ncbi:MAG: HAD family hydrolase [Bacillota bacterium]|jgi:pyrophosphatase PpaX
MKKELLVQAVLFDLDGTLVNTITLIHQTFHQVFAHLNIPWGAGEVLKTIGLPLNQVAQQYWPADPDEFLSLYANLHRASAQDMIHPYPGTVNTLRSLRAQGRKLAVVTSKRRQPAKEALAHCRLDHFFNTLVAVEDSPRPKPNADPILYALQQLGVKADQAVFIGDSWYDMAAAEKAGVHSIGVTWGMATKAELLAANPKHVIDSWDELWDLLG